MKIIRLALAAVLWVGLLEATQATDRYVSPTGTNNPPYTNWADAATSIQDAISACSASDVVWVTNGTYQTGGVTNWPDGTELTNRVAITNTITVRSVNGPSNTIIKGAWNAATTNGPRVARCVYMTNGSALIGFTLTNGATMTDDEGAPDNAQRGGGVWCESTNTIISNCVITCNAANQRGGGAYYGTLYNCLLITNLAADIDAGPGAGYGGGTYYSTLYNCTLSDNTAQFGAEANYGIAYNSVLWPGANLNIATWYHSCAPDNGGATSVTNDPYSITNNPLFLNSAAGNYRLSGNSPGINAGTNQNWMTNALDLDGRQRIMQVTADMGAYESAYAIGIPTNTFTNTVMIGSSVTNFSVYLANTNETELYWEAVNTSSWVTLSATNGIITTNATHDSTTNFIITNSAVGLALGAHSSRLNVHTTNYTYRSTGAVDMILNIAEFGRSATSLTATVKRGNATSETVRVWNKGAGALSYTVSTNAAWLAVSPVSGVLTGQTAGATNDITVVITNTSALLGTYYGTITFVSGIDGSTLDINVVLTVTTGPQMTVNPLILTGTIMMGQNLASQTTRVSNVSSTEQLGYGVTTNQSWLAVSPTNGTLNPQTTNDLIVSYLTSNLTTSSTGPSNYNATITVTATNSDALGSPAAVAVNLTVNPKAQLNLGTTIVTNIVAEGYDAPDCTFEIWNGNGYYTLSYANSKNADWFMLTPSSGTSTGEHDVITVEFNTANFTAGVSNALITVVGRTYDGTHWDSAINASQTIEVRLLVTPTAGLATDASAIYEFSTRLGHPVGSTSFQVWNANNAGGVLQYAIATNVSWLSARPTSGTSAGEENEIILTCNADNLRPGKYTGALTITGTDQATGREAYNSPLNINVELTILAEKGFDFGGDGDGASDLIVYQESSGLWSITNLFSGYTTNVVFGGKGYTPVPGDYDGDGVSDLGAHRYSSGYWYVRRITEQQLTLFGGSYWAGPESVSAGGFVPVAHDYDGDGKTDPTMYREADGLWSVLFSASGYAFVSGLFGGSGYVAIPADYDGDGKTDFAVYNETTGEWLVLYSSDNYRLISGLFGGSGFTAAPADYDGDGKADVSIYEEATGLWIILPSSTLTSHGYVPITGIFGGPGFKPVPADYNGDGEADVSLYNEALGTWYILSISGTIVAYPARHGGYGFAPVKP